jgi:AcrR family transcriptional regulator
MVGNRPMIEEAAKTRPATRRYLAKKDRIVAAATEILNATGVDGFTLAKVAERVGAHPASLGYYWRKDTLIEACILDAAGRIGAMAEAALDEPSPEARLAAFLGAYFDERRRIWLGEAADLADFSELRQAGQTAVDGYVAMFRSIARLFRGAPASTDRGAAARLTIEQIGWSRNRIEADAPADFRQAAAAMVDFLTEGLAGEGQSWPAMSLLDLAPPPSDPSLAPRDAFLVAGTRMLNAHGYRGASVDRISAQLNRTKGAFYHHHADKDEVIEACFQRTFAITREAQSRAAALPTGWERIAFAAAALAASHNSAAGLMVRSYALAGLPSSLRERMTAGFDEGASRFAGFIAEGIADGSVRSVDAASAARMIMATVNSSAYLSTWAPAVGRDNVIGAYVRPTLMGLLSSR